MYFLNNYYDVLIKQFQSEYDSLAAELAYKRVHWSLPESWFNERIERLGRLQIEIAYFKFQKLGPKNPHETLFSYIFLAIIFLTYFALVFYIIINIFF